MRDRLRRAAKAVRAAAEPVAFALASARARVRAALGGRATVRMLLVSDGLNYTSEQQFAPFRRFRAVLSRDLGLLVRFATIERAAVLSDRVVGGFDIVGLKMSFTAPEADAAGVMHRLRRRAGANARLVYFDGDDDLLVQWPSVLRQCDLYVKKHKFGDPADYAVERIGKSNLTDYVARHHGASFANDLVPASGPLPLADTRKIVVGWNIALDDKIVELAARSTPPSTAARPVDVCSRAVVAPDAWIFPLRDVVARRLEAMSSAMTVLVPRNRVTQEEYYREMQSSTICVSPFGYGELCWRDFEAILCGCLLVKPDMGHAETAPDIFVPGVTYVPVRWDYSDLAEVCSHYLREAGQRQRIVAEAYRRLQAAMTPQWFVQRVQDTLLT